MKRSQTFIPTLRETPAEAVVISHQLLLRAGMIRRLGNGLFNYLPLGLRVFRKVENIVREEIDATGCLECKASVVAPGEIWQESKRWYTMGDGLLRMKNRLGQDLVVSPTNEESFTALMRYELGSYKDYPLSVYHINTKYRDEIRPRYGLMRAREFTMKDAYSFHTNAECLDKTYRTFGEAYEKIFRRFGLSIIRVRADSGAMGGSGSEASSQASRSLRRASREIPFDQIDCRPTIYHPGGIFEELGPLPSELLRDPRAQSWGNVFDSCSSHKTVKDLLRRSGGAGVTYIIPSKGQRPWSPPIGYQCVYESYFGDHTKLWFPIPRLITSYAFRRDIAICQLLNGSLRIAVMLMVMAAEIDVSMSVRVFEELTFTKAEPHGIFSVKMRSSYNVLSGHPNKTKDWQRSYFYVKSDEHAFSEPPGDDYRVLWNKMLGR